MIFCFNHIELQNFCIFDRKKFLFLADYYDFISKRSTIRYKWNENIFAVTYSIHGKNELSAIGTFISQTLPKYNFFRLPMFLISVLPCLETSESDRFSRFKESFLKQKVLSVIFKNVSKYILVS